jgi:predicted O-methyltransferase YrrM
MLKRYLASLRRAGLRWIHRREFEQEILPQLPEQLRGAARFVFDGAATDEERRIAAEIESFRQRLKEVAGKDEIASYPSPRPATFQLDQQGHSAAPTLIASPVEKHMKTGSPPASGVLLRRIAVGIEAARILELGTNTGFSGCYFISSPHCRELVTIEGAAELCEIARQNMARIADTATVLNMYFDDALDELSRDGRMFDCAYIDGQHEREATLHYANRVCGLLRDGGCLIFDDIRWSRDMNNAWREISRDPRYAVTVDLGKKGACILGGGDSAPRFVDLSAVLGNPKVRESGHPGPAPA